MDTKVYVVNDGGHIITAAARYGKFIMLTEGNVNIFRTDTLTREFKTKMKDIKDTDYILLSGSSILNVLAVSIALMWCGKANILLYNIKSGDYIPRLIEKPSLEKKPVEAEEVSDD